MNFLYQSKLFQRVMSLLFAALIGIFQIISFCTPARDKIAKDENSIRVMSFNIHGSNFGELTFSNRMSVLPQFIGEVFPDSFGVQESDFYWLALLKAKLPEYNYVGGCRDDGHYLGESSSIFYLKDKYNVIETETFWLSETPDVPSVGWDAKMNRVCTWVILENKQTKECYVHMNTHFDHMGSEARWNSIYMVIEKAKSFDLPVILTGDLNFVEGSEMYYAISENYFHDVKFEAPDTMDIPTYPDIKTQGLSPRTLDYILVNDKVQAKTYRVMTQGVNSQMLSDHYPIYADVVFK